MKANVLSLLLLLFIAGCAAKKNSGPWIDSWAHAKSKYYQDGRLYGETKLTRANSDLAELYFVYFNYDYDTLGRLVSVSSRRGGANASPYYSDFYYSFDSASQLATVTAWYKAPNINTYDYSKALKAKYVYNTKAKLLEKYVWKMHYNVAANSIYRKNTYTVSDTVFYVTSAIESKTVFQYTKTGRLKEVFYTEYRDAVDSSTRPHKLYWVEGNTDTLSAKEYHEEYEDYYNDLDKDGDYKFYKPADEMKNLVIIPYLQSLKKESKFPGIGR